MAMLMTKVADGQVFLEDGLTGLVGLGVASGGAGAAISLTADEARKIAKKLDELAALADLASRRPSALAGQAGLTKR